MGSLNKVTLIGRLGKDVEVRYTTSGMQVASFSLATDSKWTNKAGEKQEKTEWHKVKAWGKLAELCAQYLVKGSQVYVEGRLQTNEWTDPQGVKKWFTDIVADDVQFLGSKREGASPFASGSVPSVPVAQPQDDIPF